MWSGSEVKDEKPSLHFTRRIIGRIRQRCGHGRTDYSKSRRRRRRTGHHTGKELDRLIWIEMNGTSQDKIDRRRRVKDSSSVRVRGNTNGRSGLLEERVAGEREREREKRGRKNPSQPKQQVKQHGSPRKEPHSSFKSFSSSSPDPFDSSFSREERGVCCQS